VFDSARDKLPVAHDDNPTLLGIHTHDAGWPSKVFKRPHSPINAALEAHCRNTSGSNPITFHALSALPRS